MRPRSHGQALLVIALLLPVLIGLLLAGIEISGRQAREQDVRAAIQAASRAAVQTFDYRALAEGRSSLADPEAVVAVARRVAAINLRAVTSLATSPEDAASRIRWTVLPAGGACAFDPGEPALRVATPALCASAELPLVSPLGLTWTARVAAADTLDESIPLGSE